MPAIGWNDIQLRAPSAHCQLLAGYDYTQVSANDETVRLEQDDAAWEKFVVESKAPYLQSTAWADIKAANGWRAVRIATQAAGSPIAAQLLIRRARGLPWALGYIPRGPIGGPLDKVRLAAFSARLKQEAKRQGIAYVTVEPELGPETAGMVRDLGWQPTSHIQPDKSRVIDLDRPKDQIWADVHRKARQSVSKAERLGVRVVEVDADRLPDFYRIHAEMTQRTHVVPRAESTFRLMWSVLAPRGMARMFIAESQESGEPVAGLFIVLCGTRAVDLYGGTTAEGNATRANYLLKWRAIEECIEAGIKEYDLWGLARSGIAQFKAAWGGQEVNYVGAWDVVASAAGRQAIKAGLAARLTYVRMRYGQLPTDDTASE